MADIRFVRPPCDNKIRNFSPLPQLRDTLHITTPELPGETLHLTTPKQKDCHSPPWQLFLTSNSYNKTKQSAPLTYQQYIKTGKEADSPKIHSQQNKKIIDQQTDEKGQIGFFHRVNRSSSLTDVDKYSFSNGNELCMKGSHFETVKERICSGFQNVPGASTQALSSSCMHDATHPSDVIIEMNIAHKCSVMQFCTNFGFSGDNSLVDVNEEELEQLPEVKYPAGVFSLKEKQRAASSYKTHAVHASSDHPNSSQAEISSSSNRVQHDGGHLFKYSFSSSAFEESEYKSFFGSLRKRETHLSQEKENDMENPGNRFSTLWNPRRDWIFDSSLRRTQSVDSVIPGGKKLRQMSPTETHSLTPVQSLYAVDDDEDDETAAIDEDNSNIKNKEIDENFDRLKMRRDALAQPEKMIMSQATREKVERDVEKRKASMVRRVSQFFNVQLGLNREEDLI